MAFPSGVLASRSDLAASAELLHGFCFDRVELEELRLSYEPRWSCQCTKCAAIWVASKSGTVMRIDLRVDSPTDRPTQTEIRGDREARTIYHHHDGGTLADGSCLLIGRDDGTLDIIHGEPPSAPVTSVHLDMWWDRRDRDEPLPMSSSVSGTPTSAGSFAGITAIAVIARPGKPDVILAATRYPRLYVIEARSGLLSMKQHRHEMPGWIEWIIGPQPGDDRVVLISRGGEIVCASVDELVNALDDDVLRTSPLSVLPTAAMPLGGGSLALGTTTGLFVVRERTASEAREPGWYSEGIAVPVTQSPVLCLDRLELTVGNESHAYVLMGLEGRRMRVIDTELLAALASGEPRPEHRDRSFAIELGDAVLAVESLQPDEGSHDASYVLAVLRDYSLCLFQVTTPDAQREEALSRWRERVYGTRAEPATIDVERELDVALGEPPTGCALGHWKYLLVDVVLPHLYGHATDAQVVELACRLTVGADRHALHRLWVALRELAGKSIELSLKLSRAILAAVPHARNRRWDAFVDSHLRELSALARTRDGDDHARLVAWTRFVRKYVLLGNRFAATELGLLEQVEQNYQIGKYLDALIYQTRLAQRCYDLQWESHIEGEVAEVYTVHCAGRCIVVVATVDGKLVFLDEASGRVLWIRRDREPPDQAFAPFHKARPVRTLACAVVPEDKRFRVALSCAGTRVESPGVVVIEVRPDDASTVVVETSLRAKCDDKDVRVYALQPLPQTDDFVVGLETRHAPVGRLCKRGSRRWDLELAKDGVASGAGVVDRPSLAPGKMPTRALAVAAVDDNASSYLLVAGSDDGLLRAISFGHGDATAGWQIHQGDRVTDAITSIALGRHPDDSLFSCYVGTTAGDTFAFSVTTSDRVGARFAAYYAEPRWRETHDTGVTAVQLWRTPLYPRTDDNHEHPSVLVVATETGRLSIYNHSLSDEDQVSASGHYHFFGIRFDRVRLPERVHALSLNDETSRLVAAGPGGRVYMARLIYLRDSVDRHDPESRNVPSSGDKLSTDVWQRQHHLFVKSRIEEPFESDAVSREAIQLKLELCDLVRLEGGALAAYTLRERLLFREPWRDLDADQLRSKAQRLLDSLTPEKPGDAAKIKSILKTLCRSFLLVPLNELYAQLVAAPAAEPDRRAQTAAMCEVVSDYVVRSLARSTHAATRMRIVAIKELLRVQVLRHIAIGDHDDNSVRAAIKAAIESCLRDDERLVRLETLRAVSVMVRDVGVMAETGRGIARDQLVGALFPRGLGSLTWLLELIVGGLQRYPSVTQQTALVGGSWYYVEALVGFFRIFPDRTLALCEYFVRHGLGVETLAICFQSLRGHGAATIRNRIDHLYLLRVVELETKDEFVRRYDRTKPGHQGLLAELCLVPRPPAPAAREWHELDDAVMAHRLLELLDRLGHMWNISDEDQMMRDLPTFRGAAPPAGELESVVDGLASLADGLAKQTPGALERLSELGALHGPGNERKSALTAPLRTIVSRVIAAWREVYNPSLVETGARIGIYKLGKPFAQGGFGRLFDIDEPVQHQDKHVIKVLHRNSPSAARRFLEGARFNKELCDSSHDGDYVARVTAIIDDRPRFAYVMRRYDGGLDKYLDKAPYNPPSPGFDTSSGVPAWTYSVAVDIGRGLRAAHMRERWHGDVKPNNILVSFEGPVRFRLGDFDLSSNDPMDTATAAGNIIPFGLSSKPNTHRSRTSSRGDAALDPPPTTYSRQWNDLAALSVILYRMLTGETIEQRTFQFGLQLKKLGALKRSRKILKTTERIVDTLIDVLDENRPPFTIHEFLRRIDPPARTPSKVRILFLAANPPRTPVIDLPHEFTQIRNQLEPLRKFHIDQRWEVRLDEIPHRILDAQPDILHFGGHGNAAGELMVHGRNGEAKRAPIAAIAEIFRILRERVRCVVLSACYSEQQAKAIARHIPVTIGIIGAIADKDAIKFASRFYAELASGANIKEAFELARRDVVRKPPRRGRRDLSVPRQRESTPRIELRIHVRRGVDVRTLSFVTAAD